MKFNRIFKSVLFVLAASFILWGCSEPESEETGSISFTISSDVADAIETAGAQSSYRSVNTNNLFFKISIKGDYEAEKTIAATAGSTATFDGIPVYKRIHAEASAYEQNSDGTHNVLYTGTSNTIVIRKGTNTISLALQATGNSSSSGGSGGTGGSGSGTSGGGSTTPNQTEHSITYQLNGGTNASSNPSTYTSADLPITLANPTRSGYTFGGWYTTSTFTTGTNITQITASTGNNPTLYAKWNPTVGSILLTNGTYITSSELPDTDISDIVGIVYALDQNNEPRGVLGIKNSADPDINLQFVWAASTAPGYNNDFSEIITSHTGGSGALNFTGDTDGSDNWQKICNSDQEGTANAATNYPAFNWANNYVANIKANISDQYLSGTSYASGWYIPSFPELYYLRLNRATLNTVLNAINGTENQSYFASGKYLCSTTTTQDESIRQETCNFDPQYDAASNFIFAYPRSNAYNYVLCVHKIITN